MGKNTNALMRGIKWIFIVLLTGALAFLVLAECLLPPENVSDSEGCRLFEGKWEQLLPDGTRVPVSVPGECEAQRGETVIVERIMGRD